MRKRAFESAGLLARFLVSARASAVVILVLVALAAACPAAADSARSALATSQSGIGRLSGRSFLQGARLAIENSNAAGGPAIDIAVFAKGSDPKAADPSEIDAPIWCAAVLTEAV
jgi:hypothetical protein